ncbi:MAG: LysM domain-containing protein [Blastocatellia bacterium]
MTVKVKRGDTLSKIAKANGVTLAQLLDANPRFKANPNNVKIGDEIIIPGDQSDPVVQPIKPPPVPIKPPPVPIKPDSGDIVLGKLSEKFETGGRGCGIVSSGKGDAGGASYGSYQMTSIPGGGTVKRFVSQSDFVFRDRFLNLKPGSAEFTAVWKDVAARQPDEFKNSQHEFIKRTHFDLLVKKILNEDDVDITTRSHALQDVVWSTAVQHGGGSSIVHKAMARVKVSSDDPNFDAKLISAIYAERGRKNSEGVLVNFSRNSPKVQQGVANRFKQEEKDALKMLSDELEG